jgi:uncharacterized membrane protein
VIGWSALPVAAVLVLGVVWGFSVVADSAQFSTIVTEVGDQAYVGTALTMQLAIGFTLTVATIWLVPVMRERVSWHIALAFFRSWRPTSPCVALASLTAPNVFLRPLSILPIPARARSVDCHSELSIRQSPEIAR